MKKNIRKSPRAKTCYQHSDKITACKGKKKIKKERKFITHHWKNSENRRTLAFNAATIQLTHLTVPIISRFQIAFHFKPNKVKLLEITKDFFFFKKIKN